MDADRYESVYPGEEKLQWGEGIKLENREKTPQPGYTALGEQARKMISCESQCKMFCGGKTCKYCGTANWRPEQMVIEGLYSEWVTHNILAMARMSNEQIRKYDIIKQFQEHDIKTVINLQQPGEHAHCGCGNDSSGFSYDPQILMESGVFFYNFAMEDYGVATMSKLLDIVKVMQFAVSLGKVAVHCHAGLGRTGLIIACYLIYNNRIPASKAVQYVRSRRPGSIQTKQQLKHCYKFERFLQVYFVIFTSKVPGMHMASFRIFLIRQRHILHGYEARRLKHIPKIVYVCCERLLELCGSRVSLSSIRNAIIDPPPSDLESRAGNLTNRDLSFSESDSLASSINYDEAEQILPNSLASIDSCTSLEEENLNGTSYVRRRPRDMALSRREIMNDREDNEENNDDEDEKDEVGTCDSEELSCGESVCSSWSKPPYTVDELCHCLVHSSDVLIDADKINSIEEMLNKSETAWQELAREESPTVLFCIMCDWINQLNEPILSSQDITLLLKNSSRSEKAFTLMETSTKKFLNYLIEVWTKLDPGQPDLHEQVLELFLVLLCQKRLNICPVSTAALKRLNNSISDSMRPDDAHDLFQFFQNILHSTKSVKK